MTHPPCWMLGFHGMAQMTKESSDVVILDDNFSSLTHCCSMVGLCSNLFESF